MPGSRSPLGALTLAQARALERELARSGAPLPVFVGMRNWHPFLHETLADMTARGLKRALGIILSPLRTEASWERYQQDVADARAKVGGAPEVTFARAWYDHPRFIEAVADRARASLAEIPPAVRGRSPPVFTAPSAPVRMADAGPYVADLTAAARAVADRLGHQRWSLAFQSRSGSPRDPWLEPDIGDVLTRLAANGERQVVVVPIGFVCDHVELLYDLDVEAHAIASAHGLALHPPAAGNDHPGVVRVPPGPAPVPDGFQLLAPTRLAPFLSSRLFSWPGKLRMALDLVLPRGIADDESLGAFVRRRLGREALERVAQPLVAGIYTADPDDLSLAATMPRFCELERRERSVVLGLWRAARKAPQEGTSGARWSLFVTFRNGMAELVTTLASRLPPGTALLKHRVDGLERHGHGWRVLSAEGAAVEVDRGLVAVA